MPNIEIKKGTFNLSVDRNDLIEVQETPDGISFSFKGGLVLMYNDAYMEIAAKNIMKNTSNSYEGKKLVFDLNNKRHPVMVHGD
jgi:hypothetical protein